VNWVIDQGDPFVLGSPPGVMTQFVPHRSSGSRNRPASNNNTKEDRSDGNLTLREECLAQLSAEAPTSHGASAVKGATCSPLNTNDLEDRPATQPATIASKEENESDKTPQLGTEYTLRLDCYHGDLANTPGAINGEKGVSRMVGCTIGGFAPIDVSDQSRDTDPPVGQLGWRLSLPAAEEDVPDYTRKTNTHLHNNTKGPLVPKNPNL